MTRIKMVKCALRSPGEAPAARFVPLREFSLWKYYMTHAYDKIVDREEVSIWVDAKKLLRTTPRPSPSARGPWFGWVFNTGTIP